MSLMEQWARDNGVSEADLREAGMAADQRLARLRKQIVKLQELGLSRAPEASMLRHAIRCLGKGAA